MTTILEFREKLKIIYSRYSLYILPVIKFIFAFIIFSSINKTLGFMEILENPFIIVLLSLISAIMPVSITTIIAGLMIIGHCYALGIEIAGFALILFLIMAILYYRFAPGTSLALLVTPLAYGLQIPSIIPIGYGLLGNPGASISVANGVVVYFFMKLVGSQANVLQSEGIKEIPNKLKLLIDGIIKNQNMLIGIVTCIAVVLIVYVIRRLAIHYAWRIAIFVGAITFFIIQVGASFVLNKDDLVLTGLIGVVVSILLALILEFTLFHVDYSRIEQLQYEDDEYYYYIKAVPKVSITTTQRDIKNISKDESEDIATDPEEKRKKKQDNRNPQRTQENIEIFTGTSNRVFPARVNNGVADTGNPFIDSDMGFLPEEPPVDREETMTYEDVDFEKKLEESLKNL